MPTGKSPHFIVFGREKSCVGTEHRLLSDENEQTIPATTEDEERRGIIYEQIAEEQRAAFERNKNQYNLRAKVRKFQPGTAVYIQNPKQSSAGDQYSAKLAALKKSVVIKGTVEGATDTYIVVDDHGKELGKFHANQLYTR